MKINNLLFILSVFFSFNVKSQIKNLPNDIQQFYDNKNFVSAYSLKTERDLVCLKLLRDKDLPEIKNDRLIRIKGMLIDLSRKIMPQEFLSNNKVIPFELLLPEICRPYDWEQTENGITIWLYTFTICPEDNNKFVSTYNRDKSPADVDQLYQTTLKFSSRRIHKWQYRNNAWYKSSLNLVLCD